MFQRIDDDIDAIFLRLKEFYARDDLAHFMKIVLGRKEDLEHAIRFLEIQTRIDYWTQPKDPFISDYVIKYIEHMDYLKL